MSATPDLLYVYDFEGGPSQELDDAVDYIPANYTSGTPGTYGTDVGQPNGAFGGLAIDAAAGVYFITSIQGSDSYIYEEKFGQAQQFTTPLGGGALETSLDDEVTSLALNPSDDILYFAAGDGFYEEKFSGADYSGTASQVKLATLLGSTDASSDQIVFDQKDNAAYFAAPGGKITFTTNTAGTKIITIGQVSKNFIYKVSGVTAGAAANSLPSSIVNLGGTGGELPISDGEISAVTPDTATDTLYIVTHPGILPTSSNTAGIYAYNLNTLTLKTVWQETNVTSSTPSLTDMTYITIDPTTGDYYVSDGDLSNHPGIYTGNVNSGATPTELYALPGPTNGEASGDTTYGLAIDPAPTVTSAAVTAIDGNSGKTTGTVTTADSVTISVTFDENVFVTGTPTLGLNDGGAAVYKSGSGTGTLVFQYTPSSGQNVATLASNGSISNGAIADIASTSADLTNLAATFTGLRVDTTPPVFSVTGETGDVVQGAATATTLLQTDSISDPDGPGAIVRATITIANSQVGDELSIPGISGGTVDGGAITVMGNDSTSLTLSGSASLAEYQSLLESVTYQDAGADTTTVGHPTRTIDWIVDDGVFSSNIAISTLTIDRPPTVAAGATAIFDGGQSSPTTLDPALTVTDRDGSNIFSAVVTIAGGYNSGDVLQFTNQNGITGAFSNGVLTLSGTASAANYQTALDSVAYSFTPSFGDPTIGGSDTSRSLTWSVNDGVTNSPVATSTLDVVHEPPVLTTGGTVNYSGIGPPVALDPGLSLTDPDSGDLLQGASVEISSGFLAGDTLSAVTTGLPSIVASYNPTDGVLSLTGSDTVADYQAVLQSVTFSSTAADPSAGGADPTRTFTWSVNDGVSSNVGPETSMADVMPCFGRGARILTNHGDVAVEALRVGDHVITASGRARPIVWIGHRALDVAKHRWPLEILPVRVRKDAFGENQPRRDLSLSPQHAVLVDGVLIPILRLANGATVVQEWVETVDYWHVELESHDALLAEGLPAESFLDCGARQGFANHSGFVELHPTFVTKSWADACAPLKENGPEVEAARARLMARAQQQGFRRIDDPGLSLVADGRRLSPTRCEGGVHLFAAPPDTRQLRLKSRTFRPADEGGDSADRRHLGVAVRGIVFDGVAQRLSAFGKGWHEPEGEAGHEWRWTDGFAELPTGANIIEVTIGDGAFYWTQFAELHATEERDAAS